MTTLDIKPQIEMLLEKQWSDLAATHPHLAAALDRRMVMGAVVYELARDPAYQESLARAEAVGQTASIATQTLLPMVERIVDRVMKLFLP